MKRLHASTPALPPPDSVVGNVNSDEWKGVTYGSRGLPFTTDQQRLDDLEAGSGLSFVHFCESDVTNGCKLYASLQRVVTPYHRNMHNGWGSGQYRWSGVRFIFRHKPIEAPTDEGDKILYAWRES